MTTNFEKLPLRKIINFHILGLTSAVLLFPITCIAYNLPEKMQEKTKLLYSTTLMFISTNIINIGIFGVPLYKLLSKLFPDGDIIPGLPKAINTPAIIAFGAVAIASLIITSLVAVIAYHKARNTIQN